MDIAFWNQTLLPNSFIPTYMKKRLVSVYVMIASPYSNYPPPVGLVGRLMLSVAVENNGSQRIPADSSQALRESLEAPRARMPIIILYLWTLFKSNVSHTQTLPPPISFSYSCFPCCETLLKKIIAWSAKMNRSNIAHAELRGAVGGIAEGPASTRRLPGRVMKHLQRCLLAIKPWGGAFLPLSFSRSAFLKWQICHFLEAPHPLCTPFAS